MVNFHDIDWQSTFKSWSLYDLTRLLTIIEEERNHKLWQSTDKKQ